jgi:streptomycin 3"-adenylyltransferase
VNDVASQDPAAFADRLVERLEATSGLGLADWLVGCYLHGSAALGGWNSVRSDVDLLLVASQWSPAVSEAVTAALTSSAGNCPGRGLECSVVHADAARDPGAPWPFLLHANSTGEGSLRLVDGRTMSGDPDLLMHYAVARVHGLVVFGAPPVEVLGDLPREVVLGYLHDELGWGLRHGTALSAPSAEAATLVRRAQGVLLAARQRP